MNLPSNDLADILQCPSTGRDLRLTPDGRLASDGGPVYAIQNGIPALLPRTNAADEADAGSAVNDSVRDFYETKGWVADEKGVFQETKAFSDTRSLSRAFTDRCIKRLGKYFRRGGKYILDAGSGPIPYDGLLRYSDRFEKRICVDLSMKGLHAARQKLGDRGVYIQGDMTRLPIKSGSMDAVTCNHVIYQIPPEHQAAAWLELWRVLKPGGVAVVVYIWEHPSLVWRIEKAARMLFGDVAAKRAAAGEEDDSGDTDELAHHPMPPSWFEQQTWPFSYQLDSFRVVSQTFLRNKLPNDWRGRAFLHGLFALQMLAPKYCGKHGTVPAFIIRKPKTASERVTAAVQPVDTAGRGLEQRSQPA